MERLNGSPWGNQHWRGLVALIVTAVVGGCSPAQSQAPSPTSLQGAANQDRTLILAHRYEPASLGAKVLGSNGPLTTSRLFNAALALIDDRGNPQGYLAQTLPQLNTDTWRVATDGKMETTYRLRANLTWQDGSPLTADDFVFALPIYKDKDLGIFIASPQDAIDAILVPDPQTVVIQWRMPFVDAGTLTLSMLDPLPKHLIEAPFADYQQGRMTRDAFVGSSFWTTDYVGAGPYRIDGWDPGVQLKGTAFAGHALGKPKIEHVVVKIFVDENTTLAAVLTGGQVDYTNSFTLRFEHLATLRRDWESAGKGTAVPIPSTAVYLYMQQRPEYVGDEALLDLRVRQALSHAIDRQALSDGIFDGLGQPTETPVPPGVPFYPDVDRLMAKYPQDPNRVTQLMGDAGFTRDADGLFAKDSRRFHVDFAVQQSSEIERMQAILSDTWRRAGFDVRTVVMGVQQFTQQETRHTLPGLAYAFFQGEKGFITTEIGTAANHWTGTNRTGWSNADYDRLYNAWNSSLDSGERSKDVVQMMTIVSQNLPGYALYFSEQVHSFVSSLKGPTDGKESSGFGQTSKGTTVYWNIQDWSFV